MPQAATTRAQACNARHGHARDCTAPAPRLAGERAAIAEDAPNPPSPTQ